LSADLIAAARPPPTYDLNLILATSFEKLLEIQGLLNFLFLKVISIRKINFCFILVLIGWAAS
jgi:hypothetical protein